MTLPSYYGPIHERTLSEVWKNTIEFQHPSQIKNRKYVLKHNYMDSLVPSRHKFSSKGSSHGRTIALKGFQTPLELYESKSKFKKAKNHQQKNYSFETTIIDKKFNHRKHNTLFNASIIKSSKTFDNMDNINRLQTSIFGPEKGVQRNKRYQFHTTQQLNKNTNEIKSSEILEQGKIALKKNEYENALSLFDQAYKLNAKNIEAILYKGIALMSTGMIQNAIKMFEFVILKNTKLTSSAYILLAKAYKKTNNIDGSISALTSALTFNNGNYDALILRGNLYLSIRKWVEAKSDFQAAQNSLQDNYSIYLGLAECEDNLNNPKEALKLYNKALKLNPDLPIDKYITKAKLEFSFKYYDETLQTTNKILLIDLNNSEALLIKGRTLEKKGKINDALLNYEQVAKCENSNFVSKALFKLTKIKLRAKDYYEAYFNIKRIQLFSPKMELYKILIDGIVLIIKKKHKESLLHLKSIQEKLSIFKPDIRYTYHVFKAYGYMTCHKFNV